MKEIKGFKNYHITKDGKIISTKGEEPLVMKTKKIGAGYEGLNLWQKGKHHTKSIHRLVAEAFIPNPNNLPEVNHKDGNKFNNQVDNLEWCTVSYNRKHTRRELRINTNPLIVIEDAKEKVYDFCRLYSEESGLKYTTLMNILNGHRSKPKELNHIEFIYKGNKI